MVMVDETWDVLVAHFLGIDHVGHAFDCGSPKMAAKVSQLDHYMEQVRVFCGRIGHGAVAQSRGRAPHRVS